MPQNRRGGSSKDHAKAGSMSGGDKSSSGGKKSASPSNRESGTYASGGQMPKEGVSKINESGKGSGNRYLHRIRIRVNGLPITAGFSLLWRIL